MDNHYVFAAEDKLLCNLDGSLRIISALELEYFEYSVSTEYFVQQHENKNVHIIAVQSAEDLLANMSEQSNQYQWLGLRSQLGLLNEDWFQLVGRGLQILRWHFEHQYCGKCGRPTQAHQKDRAKSCLVCGLDFYPRLSPCVIVLVCKGDYCLLANHSRSKSNLYACLAGFIEVGESPEQTVVREIMEEVGVNVDNIRYWASQPWPFPGQLMLGYYADYLSGDIRVDQEEIIDARWFHYTELPNTPRISSISGRLIKAFVDERRLLNE